MTLGKAQVDSFSFVTSKNMDLSKLVYSLLSFHLFLPKKETWLVFCGVLSDTKTTPSAVHTGYSFSVTAIFDPVT